MKLTFKMGMLFIFGYTTEVNVQGPVTDWQVTSEINEYLVYLLTVKLTKRGRTHSDNNAIVYKKLRHLKKL